MKMIFKLFLFFWLGRMRNDQPNVISRASRLSRVTLKITFYNFKITSGNCFNSYIIWDIFTHVPASYSFSNLVGLHQTKSVVCRWCRLFRKQVLLTWCQMKVIIMELTPITLTVEHFFRKNVDPDRLRYQIM